jgi:uncharacterized protein (TIGR00299 family) protein
VILYIDCVGGVAGDMLLAALLDAGADAGEVRTALAATGVAGLDLRVERVERHGISATHVDIVAPPEHVHRTWRDVREIVEAASLPAWPEARALDAFRRLAAAEGLIHRVPPEEVQFHEVGSLDAIVDIVGTCAALEVLGVDEVRAASVALSVGTVRGSHGILPNPAPAVVALLAEAGVPSHGLDLPFELTTPTGAALLAGMASGFGPLPAMTPTAVGYGAGTRDLDGRPNGVQVVFGTAVEPARLVAPGQPVTLLEVNVDDATGEVLAQAVAALLAAGAHDAWVTPIVMKKGRPAHTVSALADPSVAPDLARLLCAETGSLGVRATTMERWPRARVDGVVDVGGIDVRVKVGAGRVKVEFDDAVAAADRLGLPLREVMARAEAAGRAGSTS